MFLSTVYLSTCWQDRPITGHFEAKDTNGCAIRIQFTPEEAGMIQHICETAFAREKVRLAQELPRASVAVSALSSPEVLYTDFETVEEAND